mgnify:CR=1 FL=1
MQAEPHRERAMAFRISGITKFVAGKDLTAQQIADIERRAREASEEFGMADMFSGGKIEFVLGDRELTADFLREIEGHRSDI